MKQQKILIVAILVTILSCGASAESKTKTKALIQNGALVLDVRTPGEYAGGHYANAVNIPVDDLANQMTKIGTDKNRPIVVYCRSGRRSAQASAYLKGQGFTQVINAGGINEMP